METYFQSSSQAKHSGTSETVQTINQRWVFRIRSTGIL